MSPDDLIRLRHMLQASRQAMRFMHGRQPAELDSDEMLRMAVVHALQIVGEAAARVSKESRDAVQGVDWPAIIGMRNRLVHAYLDISVPIVWDTVTISLPDLAQRLEHVPGIEEER